MRKFLLAVPVLAAAVLVPAVSASAAPGWQVPWNTSVASYSASVNGAVRVTLGEYHAVTQDSRAACGVETVGGYVNPAVPASVKADIARDRAPKYFHDARFGSLTGNGSPTATYRSDHAGNYDLHVNGMTVTAQKSTTVYRAWVADFRGAGCNTWTEIQATV